MDNQRGQNAVAACRFDGVTQRQSGQYRSQYRFDYVDVIVDNTEDIL